jgi:pectate lyase-like protein
MKILSPLPATALAAALLASSAGAATLMTEAFDYNAANGAALNGLGGWTAGAQATILDADLSRAGLTNPIVTYSKKLQLSAANGVHSRTFNSSAIGSGSVYVSFLFHMPTLPTADGNYWPVLCLDNDANINLNSASGHRQARAGLVIYCQRINATTYQLGVRKNEGSATTGITSWGSATFNASATVLVVGKYTFGAGSGDDTVALWLNPVSLGGAEDSSPAVAATGSSNATDSQPLQYVVLVSASTGNGGGVAELDSIRVGQTWAEVTPSSGPPPSPPPSAPYFTEALLSVDAIILRGANGTTNGLFEILATTNLGLPVAQWISVSTNSFDATGHFDVTNPTAATRQFYALRLGSSSNVVAPGILSQPQDQSAPIGGSALFSVTATGSGPLSYQWYFNTNTLLTDATNSSLLIGDVQSNHIGGYSVIIANSAGSTNSLVAMLTISEPPTNGNYFVSTTGNDLNPGTIAEPFATIPKAIQAAAAGDVIYVRGGTHSYSQTIRIEKSGIAGAPIKLLAYPGEHPYLSFSNQPYGSSNRGILLTTNGNYWEIKGFEIAYAGDNAIKVEGSHNRFERLVLHHNGDTGLQIGFAHETSNDGTLGAYNEVINCDSYMNYDSDNRGSDADGFACKLHPGAGNVFIGCRAWKNSDDGWDLFETDSSVVLSNCWSWHNGDGSLYNVVGGSFQGNGNGIKLGGNGAGGSSEGVHYAYNCISFNNNFPGRTRHGFDQNSHHGGNVLYNCVAWNNLYNYFFEDGAGSNPLLFRNNVSFNGAVSDFGSGAVEDHNSWLASDHTMINPAVGSFSAADFNSIAESAAEAPRLPDGSLPTGFARLVAGSNLIDKGVDVGLPFSGPAPDLGAFEFAP